jgi:peptide chain release factor 2
MKIEEIDLKIAELEREMQANDFWSNKSRAQEVIKEVARLKEELAGGAQYDKGNAVVTILAGAGGDDAEDFAKMLAQMYFKFAERRGFAYALIHENKNDHGGFRNLSFLLRGPGVYGILKRESGVHRLVRLSPFNANQLRHTSFALVEVIPEFKDEGALPLRPEELKIEFTRSSGPGGQNVNKRETAVRIVHLPTGLTAEAQTERSQERNRERALSILRGKVYQRRQAEEEAKAQGLRLAPTTSIEWGNQIRSYVLHPYKQIKDHRSGVVVHNPAAVLDGELDPFLS